MHEYGATSEDFGARWPSGPSTAAIPRLGSTRSRSRSRSTSIALDRRAAAPARLLPGERRRPGDRRHVSRAARDLSHPAAIINSAAQGAGENQDMMTSYYRDSITGLPEMGLVARQLWNTTGLGPDDIQTAVIYDHFTPLVLPQLGSLAQAQGQGVLRDGNVELGGRLPINTHGGQLGEAYIHGMNGIAEGVRQVRAPCEPGDRRRARARHRRHGRPTSASSSVPTTNRPEGHRRWREWETQNEQQGTCDGVGQWPVVRRLAVHDRVRAPALLADRARRGHLGRTTSAMPWRSRHGAPRFRPAVRGDVTAAHLVYKLALDKLDISRG